MTAIRWATERDISDEDEQGFVRGELIKAAEEYATDLSERI